MNDNIPEGNERYIVAITNVFGMGANIGSPSILELTIIANDEPHGVVEFDQVIIVCIYVAN